MTLDSQQPARGTEAAIFYRFRWPVVVMIILFASLPSLLVLSSGAAYDDVQLVKLNPIVGAPLGKALVETAGLYWGVRSFGPHPHYYRPLMGESLVLTAAVVPNPSMKVHRVVNTAVHVFNCLLLLWVTQMLFLNLQVPGRIARDAASAAALLFATSPVAGEALGVVAARNDSMVLVFLLLAAGSALCLQWKTPVQSLLAAFAVYVFCVAALLTKESVIPPLLLSPLCIFLLVKQSRIRAAGRTGGIVAAALVTMAAIRYWHRIPRGEMLLHSVMVTTGYYELRSLLQYFLQLCWPRSMMFVEPQQPVYETLPRNAPDMAGLVTGIMAVVIASSLCWRGKPRLALLCIIWFLAWLGPALIVHASDTMYEMTERFLYVPTVALCTILGYVLAEGIARWEKFRAVLISLLAVLLVGGAFAQAAKARIWSDATTMWAEVSKTNPGIYRARYYHALSLHEAHKPEAAEVLRDVARNSPHSVFRFRATQLLNEYTSGTRPLN